MVLLLAVPVRWINIIHCLTSCDEYSDESVWRAISLESTSHKFWIETPVCATWELCCDGVFTSRNLNFVSCSVGVFWIFDVFCGAERFWCFCIFGTDFYFRGDSFWRVTQRSFYHSYFYFFCYGWSSIWCRLGYEWAACEQQRRRDEENG